MTAPSDQESAEGQEESPDQGSTSHGVTSRSPVARVVHRIRHRPLLSAVIGVVVLVVVAGGLVLLFGDDDGTGQSEASSENPVVASYEAQLPALEDAAKSNPDDAAALRAYGVALYATGDVNGAREQYEAELELNGSDPVLLNNLGNVYRDLGVYDKALQSYQEAISLDATSATAYVNLANLYQYTLDQDDLAITTLLEARVNLPDNTDLAILLGIAYEQVGDAGSARTAFQSVLDKDPANAAALAGVQRVGG